MQYETVLYDHLEYMRTRNQRLLTELNQLDRGSDLWWEQRRHLDGFQWALWELESMLLSAGLPLNRS